MKAFKQALILIVLSLLLAGSLTLVSCNRDNSTILRIDEPAPNFTLKDINGKEFSLSSYKGKAVFINFWDTTFSSCVEEMPYLQALHEDWSKSGDIVLLTIDMEDDQSTVKTFMEKQKYTFPVLLDNDYKVAEKYKVQYVPAAYFVDKYGKLKMNVVGPFKNKASIEKQISSFLGSN
jgi:peroxiredoxin